MFSISKKLTHFKTFFSLFRYKSAYFTAINSNVTPENFSDKLSEIEDSNTIFNYDENRKKLIEISKIVFPNINQFSLKRQKVIFYTFTPYQMMDPIAYKTIEKNFMKSFSTMESNEIIKFLKCLSFGKNLTISPTIFLLIEQKIMKNLSSLTPEQFLSILESYDILDLKKNNKIYKILLSYFSNKYSSMSLLHTLKAIIFFIRSKQCDIRLLTEVLEGIYNKIFIKLDSLILPHMVLIYFLFFSDFLQKNLLAKKTFENNYKFQIKENINRILLTGQSSLDTSELNDITNSFIMNPKENYEKCHIKIEEKLDKIISCHLKINDIFILFDSFLYMERKLPKNIEEEIIKYIQENNFALTPNEIFKLIEIANDERLNSVTNIKNNLIISVYNYYEKFLNEFSSVELCNLWKCIDHFNLDKKYINKIRFNLKDKVKFLNIEDILTLIILNLKELKITKNQDSKEFLDNEIFPSLKLLISQGLLKSKQIISIMKFLINYESDYMDNEFLPFFFKILNDKKMFEKAEDVVLAMNFVEFYENKISKLNLQASASETKLFLSLNYFQKETSERKIEGPINT